MIYILQPINGGAIKIGSSISPERRGANLQSLFPYGIEILATMDGGRIGEAFLHRCFEPIPHIREWFHPHPSVWRFILDVIDNGRPAFIPAEERAGRNDTRDIALSLFGDERRAMDALGYAPTTMISDVFSGANGHARVMFAKAMADGVLPFYIRDLHFSEGEVAA